MVSKGRKAHNDEKGANPASQGEAAPSAAAPEKVKAKTTAGHSSRTKTRKG